MTRDASKQNTPMFNQSVLLIFIICKILHPESKISL